MNRHLLLCFSSQQLTVMRWQRGKAVDYHVFNNDINGHVEFGQMLSTIKNIPVSIIVDTFEEDYRSETLPHAARSTRQEMIQRKLKQLYRNTTYLAAWWQGRETDKRKDDQFLFIAFTNPELIASWLELIQASSNPIAGVYLLPMVIHTLIKKLQVSVPNVLVVTQHSGGIRQTFIHQQKLKLSRLTSLDTVTDSPRSQIYAGEIQKTRLYLVSQRLIPRDDRVPVLFIDPDGGLREIAQIVQDDANFYCEYSDRSMLHARLHVPVSLLDKGTDALHLHTLGQESPPVNLAPPELTESFKRYRAKRVLYRSAVGIAAISAICLGYNMWLVKQYDEEARVLELQTRYQERLYADATKQFPKAPTSANNLKTAVEIAEAIRAESRTPEQLMNVVARALENSPNVKVKRLTWKTRVEPPNAAQTNGQTVLPSSSMNNPVSFQEGYVEGEISNFKGDYRAALADVNAFVEKLKNDKEVVNITIVELPLDVSSKIGLSGDTSEGSNKRENGADFKLMLVLK